MAGSRQPPFAGVLLGLALVLWAQFFLVRPTNFGGTDEWLFLDLAARGVLSSPYSNRPLNFLWTTPGAWLEPYGFAGFRWLHVGYLAATGWLVYALVRRLRPADPRLALLAGVFALVWAPNDMARLSSVQMTINSGFTMGILIVFVVFLESWRRASLVLLALAALLACAMARGYEATIPLLACAPIVTFDGSRETRRRVTWAIGFWAALAVAAAFVAWPLIAGQTDVAYQASLLQLDPHPWRSLARLAHQFELHLLPVVDTPLPWLWHRATLFSVAAWLGLFAWHEFRLPWDAGPRHEWPRLAGIGLGLAGAAYVPFVLTENVAGATRTQVLAMPGIGLALAGVTLGIAGALGPRWRTLTALALAAWVVAAGAARTAAMQRQWDTITAYPRQLRVLDSLCRQAPRLVPHTLVVLLDGSGAFPSLFSFRHAVEYLYPGEATAVVVGASELLYPTRFTRSGLRSEPWPVIRSAWDVDVTAHSRSEMLVVRAGRDEEVEVVATWPPELPALPEAPDYAPGARIRTGAEPSERAILTEARRRRWR